MKNRKMAIVVFMLLAALTLGIGYAAFTDTLTIIGNAHIDIEAAAGQFEEKVYFSAAEATSSTGTSTKADIAGYTDDDATYTANRLAVLGEQSVFTFTITNDSNVPVYISVADKKLSGADNPSNSNTEYFSVTYAYPQGQEIAAKGGTVTVVVTVEVAKPVTVETSATFGIELTASTEAPNA